MTTVGIVGGTGGMGRLLAGVFARAGHAVTINGRGTGPSLADLARTCEVVVVSVPIPALARVVAEVGPLLPPSALLTDVTSLKAEPLRAMLAAATCEVVGMHPLCGPQVTTLADQNVVLCPGRGERWRAWLREVLAADGARVTEVSAEIHDQRMALVQGLNHLHTLLLGVWLVRAGATAGDLAPFTTPAFRAKLDLLQRLVRMPDLYGRLVADNPHLAPQLGDLGAALDDLVAAARSGQAGALVARISEMAAALGLDRDN